MHVFISRKFLQISGFLVSCKQKRNLKVQKTLIHSRFLLLLPFSCSHLENFAKFLAELDLIFIKTSLKSIYNRRKDNTGTSLFPCIVLFNIDYSLLPTPVIPLLVQRLFNRNLNLTVVAGKGSFYPFFIRLFRKKTDNRYKNQS